MQDYITLAALIGFLVVFLAVYYGFPYVQRRILKWMGIDPRRWSWSWSWRRKSWYVSKYKDAWTESGKPRREKKTQKEYFDDIADTYQPRKRSKKKRRIQGKKKRRKK